MGVGAKMLSLFKAASQFVSAAYSEGDGLLKVLHWDDVGSIQRKLKSV